MSKKANITLLTLAAFLLLGFSIAANAAPPWLADKPQFIASAPLMSWAYRCAVTNHADVDVEYELDVLDHMGESILQPPEDPVTTTIAAGRTLFVGGFTAEEDAGLRYCTVRWVGQSGDLRASFCTWQDATDYQLEGFGTVCLDLR
jgi:hypothetical protein